MNSTEPAYGASPAVDAVIPVYRERPAALSETLSACLKQTMPFRKIIVVDDGSPERIELPGWARSSSQIELYRLEKNSGISAARNLGIAHSDSPFLVCVNAEVVLEPDWLAVCMGTLSSHATVGACYTRIISATPGRLLTRWRMRFLEPRYREESGPSDFAIGHAVLFRREAVEAVGGYDVRFRLHHEDSDICHRMREKGWETYYVAEGRCISIQEETLRLLTRKMLRDHGWYSPAESSLSSAYFQHSRWMLVRAGRDVVKGRLAFLPVDAAIWAYGLWVVTASTAGARLSTRPTE